jgi:hypothetical protein
MTISWFIEERAWRTKRGAVRDSTVKEEVGSSGGLAVNTACSFANLKIDADIMVVVVAIARCRLLDPLHLLPG